MPHPVLSQLECCTAVDPNRAYFKRKDGINAFLSWGQIKSFDNENLTPEERALIDAANKKLARASGPHWARTAPLPDNDGPPPPAA